MKEIILNEPNAQCPNVVNNSNWISDANSSEVFSIQVIGRTIVTTRIDINNKGWNFTLKIVCGVHRRSFLYDEECLSSMRSDEMLVPVKRKNVVIYKYGTYDYLHGVRSASPKECGVSKKASSSSVLENSYAFPSRVVDGMHNSGNYDETKCAHTTSTGISWIQVDLGSKRTIGEINLISRNTNDCSCAASQSAGWILKIENTGNINVVDSFETKRGDCIQYAIGTTTCTQYRNTQCSLHVTKEEECHNAATLHGGPSNVDDNLGFGVVYRD